MGRQQKKQELKTKMAAFKKRICTCGGRLFINGQCIACVKQITIG